MSKMTNCKACGKEIAKGAKTCPSCGKDQRNFFMKHKILTGIIIIIIIGIIGAVNSSGNTSPSSSSSQPSGSNNPTQSTPTNNNATKLKDSYAVGETAKYKDVEMTVIKVDKSNGTEYDKPKDGKEFVIVTVKIKNNSSKNLAYNPFYFKMKNSKGQIEDGTFSTVNKDTALNSGDLASGGEVEGTVIFEEPVGDNGLILQYQDNVFMDNAKLQFKIS